MLEQEFSVEHLKLLKYVFNKFDTENSGYIRSDQVLNCLQLIGNMPVKTEVELKLDQFDDDLSFDEFISLATPDMFKNVEAREKALWEAFGYFDASKRGKLPLSSIIDILSVFGEECLTTKEAKIVARTYFDQDIGLCDYAKLIDTWKY